MVSVYVKRTKSGTYVYQNNILIRKYGHGVKLTGRPKQEIDLLVKAFGIAGVKVSVVYSYPDNG